MGHWPVQAFSKNCLNVSWSYHNLSDNERSCHTSYRYLQVLCEFVAAVPSFQKMQGISRKLHTSNQIMVPNHQIVTCRCQDLALAPFGGGAWARAPWPMT